MRAKFVKENLDFERGQDPKKSMGIGDEAIYQKISDMMLADGWTPVDPHESDSAIGWAVEYNHIDMAKFLLDRDLTDEARSHFPDYIHWSAVNKNLDMLKILLSYNPDPSKLDFALRMASQYEPAYILIKNYIEKNQ